MKKMYAEMLINGICHGAYFVDNFSDWGVTPNYATRFSWPGEDDTEATFDWKDGEGILDIKLKEIEICGAKCNIPPWIDEDSNQLVLTNQQAGQVSDICINLKGKGMSLNMETMPLGWYEKGVEHWKKKEAKYNADH